MRADLGSGVVRARRSEGGGGRRKKIVNAFRSRSRTMAHGQVSVRIKLDSVRIVKHDRRTSSSVASPGAVRAGKGPSVAAPRRHGGDGRRQAQTGADGCRNIELWRQFVDFKRPRRTSKMHLSLRQVYEAVRSGEIL